MAQKLKVTSHYRNRQYVFNAGDIIEVDDALACWLMADSSVFVPVEDAPEVKDVDAPPVDKMMRKPKTRKGL